MRFWIFYSVSVVLSLLSVAAKAVAPPDAAEEKRILIINSYSERNFWSRSVMDSLESCIHKMHPGWMVYTGHLKTESATYASAATLTLRSILWGYAERAKTKVDATSLKLNSIFVQDDVPDALVYIGDEGFISYNAKRFVLGKWKHVPIILCAVGDSVSSGGWYPERGFDFTFMYNFRNPGFTKKIFQVNDPQLEVIRQDKELRITQVKQDGKDVYYVDVDLKYCGNIVNLPVRRNLELIHRLMPDLQELIWVDDDSYLSMKTRVNVEKVFGEIMPGVKYSTMIHNRMNTDSIYDVMLEPARHRAFLTYSWNIDALHSRRSDKEIDSLFTNVSTVPLFTITERDFDKDNYWVGGCFLNRREAVNSTMGILERAVRGEDIMTLPFDTLTDMRTILNRTALKRYGLVHAADTLQGVTFVHIPPTFFRQYEKRLLLAVLVLAMIVCYSIISWRRSRYNRQVRADYARYKRLYDKLQVIYANSSIDFALYDEHGHRLLRIVNGKVEAADDSGDLFFENIFESPCLSEDLKEQIRSNRAVNCEVSLDYTGKLSRTNFAENSVYQLIVKPLHEVKHRSTCFMAIAINLTPTIRERREKERFEDLFHFASDSSQVGVGFYDIDTAVGMATESWCKNMNEDFVSGKFPAYGQVVEADREMLLNFRKDIRLGEKPGMFCRDIRVEGKDGEKHWIRQHMYFIESSNRLIELSLDIDEQKKHEKKLEEAKRKAEEANEETREFLSSISHEVRTPLNSIVGFSAILAALDDEESSGEYASIIMRNSRLLDALMNNILDLSLLDADKVTFCPSRFNVADVFADMEAYIRNNLYSNPLQVIRELPECEADRFITTDLEYLRVLLLNLLSNAVKFTDSGSITLGCRKDSRGFYFYITDTGCGIDPENQKYIFNRFVKLDTYIQGTGLGLALCKSIVKHLNGEIGVISEKGKGSTFWFVLPDER